MRRTLLAFTAALAIATTGACTSPAEPSASVSPSTVSNTKDVCVQLAAKIKPMMEDIGTVIGVWVSLKQDGEAAAAKVAEGAVKEVIANEAAEIKKLALSASDPKLKEAIGMVAANMNASTGLEFLGKVKTTDEIQEPLTKAVSAWLLPLTSTCETK